MERSLFSFIFTTKTSKMFIFLFSKVPLFTRDRSVLRHCSCRDLSHLLFLVVLWPLQRFYQKFLIYTERILRTVHWSKRTLRCRIQTTEFHWPCPPQKRSQWLTVKGVPRNGGPEVSRQIKSRRSSISCLWRKVLLRVFTFNPAPLTNLGLESQIDVSDSVITPSPLSFY